MTTGGPDRWSFDDPSTTRHAGLRDQRGGEPLSACIRGPAHLRGRGPDLPGPNADQHPSVLGERHPAGPVDPSPHPGPGREPRRRPDPVRARGATRAPGSSRPSTTKARSRRSARRARPAAEHRNPNRPASTTTTADTQAARWTAAPASKEILMAKRPSNPERASRRPRPRELPLVALRETVIFPEMIVPLQVGREKSVAGAQRRRRRRRRRSRSSPSARPSRRTSPTRPSCTRSAPWPRSPRSSSSRTAPSGPSSRARAASASLGFVATEPYIRRDDRGARRASRRPASRSRR